MENEKFLCLKLKVKGLKGNFFAEKRSSIVSKTKKDLIELILQSEECQVEPTHSALVEMARREKIKNRTILTKYELKKELGIVSEDDKHSQKLMYLQVTRRGRTLNSLLAKKRWME